MDISRFLHSDLKSWPTCAPRWSFWRTSASLLELDRLGFHSIVVGSAWIGKSSKSPAPVDTPIMVAQIVSLVWPVGRCLFFGIDLTQLIESASKNSGLMGSEIWDDLGVRRALQQGESGWTGATGSIVLGYNKLRNYWLVVHYHLSRSGAGAVHLFVSMPVCTLFPVAHPVQGRHFAAGDQCKDDRSGGFRMWTVEQCECDAEPVTWQTLDHSFLWNLEVVSSQCWNLSNLNALL